jgi:hypothetical protein
MPPKRVQNILKPLLRLRPMLPLRKARPWQHTKSLTKPNRKQRESLHDGHDVNRRSVKRSSQQSLLLRMLQKLLHDRLKRLSRQRLLLRRLRQRLRSNRPRRLSPNQRQSLSD